MKGDSITVDSVMQKDLHFIDGLSSVAVALAKMREHGVSSLVIERREPGDEYGFLTVTEIAKRVIAVNKPFDRTAVYEVMDKPILTISPTMRVKYAVRLLAQLDRRRALVEDNSGLLGFVSLRDLVLNYANQDA